MRKSLGLDRLPVKVNKQQTTSTLELWVLYQQLKLTAAADAAKSCGQQLAEGARHGHVKADQPHEPKTSLVHQRSEAAGAQSQTENGLPAVQHLKLLKSADNAASAVGIGDQIPGGLQPHHSGQHTQQARSRPDAL